MYVSSFNEKHDNKPHHGTEQYR